MGAGGEMLQERSNPERTAFFRAGSVAQIVQVIGDLGLDCRQVMTAVGVSPEIFHEEEALLPLEIIDELISEIERATGCDHLGFLMGRLPCNLGLPEFLLRTAPTVRQGWKEFIGFMNSASRAGAVYLNVWDDEATVGYVPVVAKLKAAHHISDYGLAQIIRMLRDCCGPDTRPIRLQMPRKAVADTAPYRQFFGVVPSFDAGEASITFDAKLLDFKPLKADPQLHALLKKYVPGETRITTFVTRLLPGMIFRGDFSNESVADAIGVRPRTLHRKLAIEGTTYRAILASVRLEMGRQLVEQTSLRMSAISGQLAYSDLPSFSREFRKVFGVSPKTWRRTKGGSPPDG